jgi:hypothetical protein
MLTTSHVQANRCLLTLGDGGQRTKRPFSLDRQRSPAALGTPCHHPSNNSMRQKLRHDATKSAHNRLPFTPTIDTSPQRMPRGNERAPSSK